MRTSEDVYNKIIWDAKYQKEKFIIGYRNFNTIVELKFVNWIPIKKGGEIPWHRIEYFKDGNDKIVWHKTKRIDAIFNSGENEPFTDDQKGLKSFANIMVKPLMKTDSSTNAEKPWTEVEFYQQNYDLDNFSMITWNILADKFNEELNNQQHLERYQNICNLLRTNNYDLICLQEVTSTFIQVLNSQDETWLSEYWISDYYGYTFENDMGVIILSRIPCTQAYMLCDTKNTLIAEFTICGYSIKIANLHLTSDHHGNSKERRRIVLSRVYRIIRNDPSSIWFIAGDFNAQIDELRKSAPWLLDYDRTYIGDTFCPTKNYLADLNSRRKDNKQIDHIFITPDNSWHLLDSQLINQEYSDHYGLSVKIELYTGTVSNDTCLVIVPPLKYWSLLLGKRWIENSGIEGDYSLLKKWVPHVSIMLGYYEPNSKQFDLAAIQQVFTEHTSQSSSGSFKVKFDQPKTFQDSPVLVSEDNNWLKKLEKNLRKLCPTATRHLFHGEYTPHLTLPEKTQISTKSTGPIEWEVDHMFIDVKEGLYFKHRYRIGAQVSLSNFDVDEFIDALKAIFPTIKFQVIGSRFYLDDKTADLDMIAYGLLPQEDFYDRVVWIGEGSGYFEHTYVTDSKIKIVKMFNRAIGHVDLQYIQCSQTELETCPSTWKITYDQLELVDKSRILVLQDNLYYNKILTEEQKDLINQVKRWAKNRRIYLNCVGYLSGIVITVMVVFSKTTNIADFIKFYKNIDFGKVTISEKNFKVNRNNPIDKLMFISSPIYPFNLNVKVTQSAVKWITDEINHFTSIDDRLRIQDINKPYIRIDLDELGVVEYGRLNGRLVNIIVLLEQKYRVYTHAIIDSDSNSRSNSNTFLGQLYLFLDKDRETSVDSKSMVDDIKQWFKDNEFYARLVFGKTNN